MSLNALIQLAPSLGDTAPQTIDALSKLIGKKVKTLEITSWNVLDKF